MKLNLKYIFTIDVIIILNYKCNYYNYWVINSAVECLPYKQKVTGSNPVLPMIVLSGSIV